MISKIVVPNLGATGTDLTLVSWLVKTGDYVKAGSVLNRQSTNCKSESRKWSREP